MTTDGHKHTPRIRALLTLLPMVNVLEVGGWDDLTSEAALDDSPVFRATLQKVEDEVEMAGRWLDSFIKSIRDSIYLSSSTDYIQAFLALKLNIRNF